MSAHIYMPVIEKVKDLVKTLQIGDRKTLTYKIDPDTAPKAEERHHVWNNENA